jgi:hypothetical protein
MESKILKWMPDFHVGHSGIPFVSANYVAFSIFDCLALYRPLWLEILT